MPTHGHYDDQLSKAQTKEVWGQSFDVKTLLLPWATGSVSNSNLSAVP